MDRVLDAFDLHEWHNDNDPNARSGIGASGIATADLRRYLPKTADEWERLWRTPPNKIISDLQQQIAAAYGLRANEILITNGASEADFLAAFALTRPGDRVLVEQPAYFALLNPAKALGCKVDRVVREAKDDFALPLEAARQSLQRKPKLVLLARPNNPTGARVPDEDLVGLARSAQRVGAHVLVDEVFAEATREGDVAGRILHDRILSVNSITKCLGFGPMHVGWIAGPKRLIERVRLAKEHVRPLNAILPLALAARILPHRSKLLEATRRRRERNARTIRAFLAKAPELDGRVPQHGTTMVVRLPARMRNDVAFAKRLLAGTGVLVSPGSYLEMPGWIRLGLLSDPKSLQTGLRVLGNAVH